ncbi:MAG: CopG family ribbon-helix-helix protein [Promethearchaeota archaeon]
MTKKHEEKSERKIVSFSVSSQLYNAFEDARKQKGYPNRSNAIQDLIESFVSEETSNNIVTALLIINYDHDEADLVQLIHIQHLHMEMIKTLASFHLHLTEDLCSDLIAVKGPEKAILSIEHRFRQVVGVSSVRRAIIHVEI